MLNRWWRRLVALGRGAALDREMDEEMALHVEREAADLEASGLGPEEARREARLRFGGVARHQDDAREARGVLWARDFAGDARYAVRSLRRAPAFTLAAVLTLAVGIGASATIFAVTDAYVFRPLPFPHGERIVQLSHQFGSDLARSTSVPDYEDWQAGARAFDTMAAEGYQGYTYQGTESAEHVEGRLVSSGYFALFGQRPLAGRDIAPSDDVPGAAPVVVVSRAFWRARLGGTPDAVGRVISLDGRPFTVIGVMDHGLETLADPAQVFLPMEAAAPHRGRGTWFLSVYARLRDGVGLADARADLADLARRLGERYHWTGGGTITALPLRDELVGEARRPLLALFAAVGFLLLIAIANLAGLLQARASARTREYAVRAALGAGRGRLARQTATEALLLTAFGAGAGALVAVIGTRLVLGLWPASLPRPFHVGVDLRVLGFAIAASLAAGLLAGFSPGILRLSGRPLRERRAHGGGRRVRRLLVAGEVALTVVLLVGAGLMGRALDRLLSVDPGFRTAGVTTLQVELPTGTYGTRERQSAFYDNLLDRVRRIPGVQAAGAALNLPMAGTMNGAFSIEGRTWPSAEQPPEAAKHVVTPGYLDALGIPLLRGRAFTATDRAGAPGVALVNQTVARRFWPGQEPLGRRIQVLGDGWQEIVGVVGDVRLEGLDQATRLETYLPFDQWPYHTMYLAVRHDADRADAVIGALRSAVRAMDRGVTLYRVRPLADVVTGTVATRRLPAFLFGAFAAMALLLAAVGLYGVLAYSVSRRTGEIAVRMALGAREGAVMRQVVGEGMRLVAAGAAVGLVLAAAVTRLISGLLFDVRPLDAASYAGALAVLALVALAACWAPALRAARVDPSRALQAE